MEKPNVLQIDTAAMNMADEQMLIASKIGDILRQYPRCFSILKDEFFSENTFNKSPKDLSENTKLRLYAEIVSSEFKKKQTFAQTAQGEISKNIKRDAA